jgi:uncharacterized protein
LLALAARALGRDGVVAILGVSPSLAAEERAGAHLVASFVSACAWSRSLPRRVSGPSTCATRPIAACTASELFTRLSDEIVEHHGLAAVAYGENADDARRPRPPAAVNHAILRPLPERP